MEIKKNKITVVLGLTTDLNLEEEKLERIFETSVTLGNYLKSKFKNFDDIKIQEAMKICLLRESDFNKPLNYFSNSEIEKTELMIKLLQNQETIILSDFENNFGEKELAYFKKLFKKMTSKYNKTIVFITNSLDELVDIVDFILVVDNKNVVLELNGNDIYEEKIYKYVDEPKIVNFVNYLNKKNIKIEKYNDISELAKAIYRSVS